MCQCCDVAPQPGYLGYSKNFNKDYIAGWRLGRGNCGQVYTGIRRSDGKKLAVKCISKDPEDVDATEEARAEHLRLIKNEIEILKLLKGLPSVLQIENVYEDESKVYLITELCKGGALPQRRSKYSERDVVRFMRSVLEAILFCHANGVIHRDIKHDNFMLKSKDKRSEVKVIDFGIAARFTPDSLPVDDLGHPCGTLWFMAPEVCKANWWPTSDVWAAGIMAAQMLTGKFPFNDALSPEDPDPARTFRIIRNDPLDQSGPEWAKVSPLAVDFVRHILVKDPKLRPTAAQALQHPFMFSQGEFSTPSSLASSLMSTPNISIDPLTEELPYPFPEGAEPAKLAKRLSEFSLSRVESSSSFISSPSYSFDPMTEELPYPSTPGNPEPTSLLKRLKKFAKFGTGKKEVK